MIWATLGRGGTASTYEETNCLKCEVCDFDFRATYGDLGEGFAECHHVLPLAELAPGTKTKLRDLAILCANCHRMAHRKGGVSLNGLRERLKRSST